LLEGQPGTTSCYNGAAFGNAPNGDGNWFFIEVMRHINPVNYYAVQRATGMTGPLTNQVYQRYQQNGGSTAGVGWSAWVRTDGSGGLGIGQAWQNMSGSSVGCAGVRDTGAMCTNITGKPIEVSITDAGQGSSGWYALYVDGVLIGMSYNTSPYFVRVPITATVPNGSSYFASLSAKSIYSWAELR
jgi:hypothetical protein